MEAFETNDPNFDGRLRSIQVKEGDTNKNPPSPYSSWIRPNGTVPALRAYIDQIYFRDRGDRSSAEAILVLHPKLKYIEIVKVMTAISGKVDDTGHLIKLFEKISFEAPKE